MSTNTSIEWTEATWSPVTGCDRVSPGCDHCYAMTLAKRLKAMGSAKYQTDGDPRTSGPGFGVATHESALHLPLRWRKPRKIFVNSMSDLFHDSVPDEYIAKVFVVMALASHHTFQLLTKRHARMRSLLSSPRWRNLLGEADSWSCGLDLPYPTERFLAVRSWIYGTSDWSSPVSPLPNVWLGVSVENQQWADIRVPALMKTPAAVRFLSCEPLLGPIHLHHGHTHCPTHDFSGGFCTGPCPDRVRPNWIIAGGESGAGHRPLDLEWARSLRDQCARARIPFMFKQVGGRTSKAGGRELDGRTHDEYPEGGAA